MEEETKEVKIERRKERIEKTLQKQDGRIQTWEYAKKLRKYWEQKIKLK